METERLKTIDKEVKRLAALGLYQRCVNMDIKRIAALTLRINSLKKKCNAVICAHVYQRPEIILGIGDLIGDSYKLADQCRNVLAKEIIFCGVYFMAETAKILNPEKKVYVPSNNAGCSLSESISAEDVRSLKAMHPQTPVVVYINTSAAVKAEADCVVTSANALKILERLYKKHSKIIFAPDRLMGVNLAKQLGKTPGKEIILWKGSCLVHEKFNGDIIGVYRRKYPGLAVLAHSECPSDVALLTDFTGGTSDMMKYIENTSAQGYLLITECGFGELAVAKFPQKKFIAMCGLCPYMKSITLESVLDLLQNAQPQEVSVPAEIALRAKKAIEQMFKLAA